MYASSFVGKANEKALNEQLESFKAASGKEAGDPADGMFASSMAELREELDREVARVRDDRLLLSILVDQSTAVARSFAQVVGFEKVRINRPTFMLGHQDEECTYFTLFIYYFSTSYFLMAPDTHCIFYLNVQSLSRSSMVRLDAIGSRNLKKLLKLT